MELSGLAKKIGVLVPFFVNLLFGIYMIFIRGLLAIDPSRFAFCGYWVRGNEAYIRLFFLFTIFWSVWLWKIKQRKISVATGISIIFAEITFEIVWPWLVPW